MKKSIVKREIKLAKIFFRDNALFTTSLVVAQVFSKEHKHVLEAIRNLECSSDFAARNFQKRFRINELANGRRDPYHEISSNGLDVLKARFNCFDENLTVETVDSYVLDKVSFKNKEQLYVILFDTGMIKVGKGKDAVKRVNYHAQNAQIFDRKMLKFYIEENPKITEQDLISHCLLNGTLVSGKEYFKDLKYEDVVKFVQQKIEKCPLRLVSRPFRNKIG